MISGQGGNGIRTIDFKAVKDDITKVLTDSKDHWPADYGNYGPLFIRLAWHASGSYRASDGRGGSDGGRLRFDPERSWADNTNLDKARSLLKTVKDKYGKSLSWADLIILAGDTAIEAMGGPILGFCGGRIDDADGSKSDLLGPTTEQEELYPCVDKDNNPAENGACKSPLGPTTVGLIYVNPEGPMGNPIPKESVLQVRDTFSRMGMNDSETVALIGGGHAIGKTHGACPFAPGPSPKEDPENPWPGVCGEGSSKGKGINTVTSGFDFPWTTTPIKWSNQYFVNLLAYNWTLKDKADTLGGHYEWEVDERGGVQSPEAPAADNQGRQKIGMLTADVSLLQDPTYKQLVEQYKDDPSAFDEAFQNAWYKLTTRDMGPRTRCINKDAPPSQEWQYPLPVPLLENELPDWENVKEAIVPLLTSTKKGSFVRLAWQCMSTFRSTDYRGGCNGARIRFEPQNQWDVNIGLNDAMTQLMTIKDTFTDSLSWGDLIILAGNVEIESMSTLSLPFCPGRTDATADDGASTHLEPKIMGEFGETSAQLKEFIELLGLTFPEYAALHGAGYAIGQGDDCAGLFCKRDSTSPSILSNMFFRNILQYKWVRSPALKMYETNASDLRMTSADVQFLFDPILNAVAEEYENDEQLFLQNIEVAWTKLANADRFGGVCDK